MLTKEQHDKYRSIVGRLYSNVDVWIDLMTTVRECARACSSPTLRHLEQLRVVRYVSGTAHHCLELKLQEEKSEKREKHVVTIETDAAWGSSTGSSPVSGCILRLDGLILLAYSRTQSVIAHSSCEAEIVAIHERIC